MRTRLPGLGFVLFASGLVACGGPEPEVTWHADINPMMQQHCTRCHQPEGLGVGDFTDIEVVRSFSERIAVRTEAGTMPPPAADPECADYVGSEHLSLPDEKVDLFRQWMELEMPEGDPDTAPDDLPVLAEELTDADLTLLMPEPYEPAFADPQNPGNEYRCFVLDHGRDEDFYVTAFHPVIGEPALVHHVLLLTLNEDDLPDDYDPAMGVDCMEGRGGEIGDVDGMVAGWAPGMPPVEFNDGRGIRVSKDQHLVIQMHYYQAGPHVDGLADQSGYAVRTTSADQISTSMIMAPFGLHDFYIPAGDADHTETETIDLPVGGRVHAVFPHMHVLGKHYKVWLERDGVEQCISEGDYAFDNQISYVLKEPIPLQAGDKLNLSCTWDNSVDNPDRILETPVDTSFGERTDEEMCYAFSLVSIGN